MSDCAVGCKLLGLHLPGCLCTLECTEHKGHCKGCIPEQAVMGRLCSRCLTAVRNGLAAIPDLTVQVASRADGKLSAIRKGEVDSSRNGTKGAAPSLSPAWDTAEEVCQWALRLALSCADAKGQAGPFIYRVDGVPARNLTSLIGYVSRNLLWYTEELPKETHAEITSTHRSLIRLTGADHDTDRIKDPCPTCDRRTLARDVATGEVHCRNKDCGRIWREGEYEQRAIAG